MYTPQFGFYLSKRIFLMLVWIVISFSCTTVSDKSEEVSAKNDNPDTIMEPSLIILGTVQDGGSPHIGCKKECCRQLFLNQTHDRFVVSIGVVDPQNQQKFIFECTPDFPVQAKKLFQHAPFTNGEMPDAIFLTHAHIGHYTGLMYLGKEATNADSVKVYAMPRMKKYLETNGPWSQLVTQNNISIQPLFDNQKVKLTSNISVTPVLVPHRDEYSETVGYVIEGPSRKVLFIPDIDKWDKWDKDISKVIAGVNYAFIDGTFYDGDEINTRNIASIPHPFITESMNRFANLSPNEKKKIHFIHFNHTNKALESSSEQTKTILQNGFEIAQMDQVIKL